MDAEQSSLASISCSSLVALAELPLRIRRGLTSDEAAVRGLLASAPAFGASRGDELRARPFEGLDADKVASLLDDERRELLLAELGEELVGLALLTLEDATLHAIYVAPERRRQGLGKALVEAAERAVRDAGGASLVVLAGAGNRAEKSLLEALGYRAELLVMGRARALVPCAGAVLVEDGHLLVIRRAHEPGLGLWSLPGGHVEANETAIEAAAREVLEETGLEIKVGEICGSAQLGGRYEVINFNATRTGGTLRAASDVSDCAFVSLEQLRGLDLSTGLLDWLDRHGVLARLC